VNEERVLALFAEGKLSADDVLAYYADHGERSEPADPADQLDQPLSEGQRGLWLLQRLDPDSDVYHLPVCFLVRAEVDLGVLERAFQLVVGRHGQLAGSIVEADGEPRLARRAAPADFHHHVRPDLTADTVRPVLRAAAREPFDLAADSLVRAHVYAVADGHTVVLLVFHHIVFDGASTPVFLTDLVTAYQAGRDGTEPRSWSDRDNYADFVAGERAYLAGPRAERDREFWRRTLAGELPVLTLDVEREAPAGAPFAAATHTVTVPVGTSAAIRRFCAANGANPAVLFLAVYQLLLHRHSGERDVIIGLPTVGRPGAEFAGTIGYFISMVPLRHPVRGEESITRYLRGVSLALADGIDHAAYPFPRMVRDLGSPGTDDAPAIFQVFYAFQNKSMTHVSDAVRELELARTMEFVDDVAQRGVFKLNLEVFENVEDFTLRLKYDATRFAAEDVRRFVAQLMVLLDHALAHPDRPLSQVPSLTEPEREQLRSWNDTARPFSHDRSLPQLLTAAVAEHGDRPAVRFGDRALSYREFAARVERTAARLRGRGVGPDTVVGICAERSIELVVAIWAVLAAGGAYLPLEPDHPEARLRYLIEDSGAVLVLTQPELAGSIRAAAGPDVPVVPLDRDGHWPAEDDTAAAPLVPAGPGDLAYVIYTSGSTGRPKGVMVEHRAVVNRIEWMQGEYGLAADDVVVQKTPFGFDVSVWEFVWPLVSGACLVVAEPGAHRDPDRLVALIRAAGVTTVHFVPPLFRLMVEHPDWGACTSLRRVICSGEALPPDLPARHHAVNPAAVHNLYGPTEAAIDVTHWTCPAGAELDVVPIGRPIQNIRLHVLNDLGQPQGVGTATTRS
jgi:amino acid adenylation domain-containing protein